MKKGTSKKRGNKFENDICKQLSLWWTYNERDDVFCRTTISGGKATERAKKDIKTPYDYGDITFRDPIGKQLIDCFVIECKRGYTDKINILDLFEKKSKLLEWIDKLYEECDLSNIKNFLLILKRNRKEEIVFINYDFFSYICMYSGDFNKKYLFSSQNENDFSKNFYIIKLEDFLNWISPEDIEQFVNEYIED